jgi:hypothetical protein
VPSSATITDVPSVRGVTGLISSPLIWKMWCSDAWENTKEKTGGYVWRRKTQNMKIMINTWS